MSDQQTTRQPVRIWRLLVKAALLFLIVNVLWFVVQPMNLLNKLTVYNTLVPGRERFPFSDLYPAASYSVSISNLDQMLASHVIAQPKAADEYRVMMLGDSSIWGYLLQPDQTQAACLNRENLSLSSGKKLRFYNLGYPKLSVTKDLLTMIHAARDYAPDMVVWPMTLASLYTTDQLDFSVVTAQRDELASLIAAYHFKFEQWPLPTPGWFDRTLIGQRRDIADWLRYQLYGLDWTATGVDHTLEEFVAPHPSSFVPDDNLLSVNVLHTAVDHKITEPDLSLDVIRYGLDFAWNGSNGTFPVLLINEPIYRSDSNPLRYDTYYPRWAYDSYRATMQSVATRENWHYVDFWDAVPPDQFTDTDFHLTPEASCTYAAKEGAQVLQLANSISGGASH